MDPFRLPPKVLVVHKGSGYEAHIKHLTSAGLQVSETHRDSALADATTLQPDIVVLDFGLNGDLITELKTHAPTRHIPVITLGDLMPDGQRNRLRMTW